MMYLYLNLSIMMFMLMLILFIFFLKFIFLSMKLFIEMNLYMLNSMNFSLMIYFDWKSFLFMSIVMLISSMIFIYSIEYMMFDNFNIRFFFILMLFVFSMLFMIVGQNLLMILVGWDGLGLISFCLVIYYNNWSSYNSGMITLLMNRLGDIGLLMLIGGFGILGDWNFLLMKLNLKWIFFLIILLSFTKSAQIPFSSWLPKAMAAPTPVSSLVHSSTLVTAGVYMMIRFSKILFQNKGMMIMIFYLSLMTMFFSGVIAMFENDLKKIIALSTLSQLGLMMISLMLKMKLLSFFHLLIHALFKSLLFMCAGLILHSSFNNQDIRLFGCLNFNYIFTLIFFNCANLALSGFPFMSGFYSKDLILEFSIFKNLNLFILMIFYLSIFFTVFYSFRLIYFLILNYKKFYCLFCCNDSLMMNFSMFLLFLFSLIGGSVMNWLIFNSMMLMNLEFFFKIFILLMIFTFMIFGIFLYLINENKFILKLMNLFNFFCYLLMMNYLLNLMIFYVLKIGMGYFLKIEKGWNEFMGFKILNWFYINIMNLEKFIFLLILKMMMIYLLLIFM